MIKNTYKSYVNKYIKIIDKSDNLICSGLVVSEKPNMNISYISFDNKWFYGQTQSLIFVEMDYVDTYIPEFPPLFLKWAYWRDQFKLLSSVDVYRDFDYDEIDPPIKSYVDKLNEITPNLKTVASCCGHGINDWWINIQFFSINTLYDFLTVLNAFQGKLALFSDENILQYKNTATFTFRPDDKYSVENKLIDPNFELLNNFIKKLNIKLKMV